MLERIRLHGFLLLFIIFNLSSVNLKALYMPVNIVICMLERIRLHAFLLFFFYLSSVNLKALYMPVNIVICMLERIRLHAFLLFLLSFFISALYIWRQFICQIINSVYKESMHLFINIVCSRCLSINLNAKWAVRWHHCSHRQCMLTGLCYDSPWQQVNWRQNLNGRKYINPCLCRQWTFIFKNNSDSCRKRAWKRCQ